MPPAHALLFPVHAGTSRPVAYMISQPSKQSRRVERRHEARRAAPGEQPPDLVHHLDDRAGADGEEERGPDRRVGEPADPGAQHRRHPREGAEQEQRACPDGAARRRAGRRCPVPRSCCAAGIRSTQERSQRDLAGGVRRPDREPLAQVVQPDPERDQAARRRAASARARARAPAGRSRRGRAACRAAPSSTSPVP